MKRKPTLLVLAALLSAPFAARAQTSAPLRTLQREAIGISATASWLDGLDNVIFARRAAEVVPDEIYRLYGRGIDELVVRVARLSILAKATGQPGLIGEALSLLRIAAVLPKGRDIPALAQQAGEKGDNSALVPVQEAVEALRSASPCIRREIQELDE